MGRTRRGGGSYPLKNQGQLQIQVRHRRTCREARAPKELSSARLCDPPEALSWKEIGLPPRLNCYKSPPIEVGVLSPFKIKKSAHIQADLFIYSYYDRSFSSVCLSASSVSFTSSSFAFSPIWPIRITCPVSTSKLPAIMI